MSMITNEKVKKAIECCIGRRPICSLCPLSGEIHCQNKLRNQVLGLINYYEKRIKNEETFIYHEEDWVDCKDCLWHELGDCDGPEGDEYGCYRGEKMEDE